MDNFVQMRKGNEPLPQFNNSIKTERNKMEKLETKYVCIKIEREPLNYLFQVDKSVDLEELDDDDFREYIKETHYEEIHDHTIDIREISENSYFYDQYNQNGFLYKSGDHIETGKDVPPNTKSIILYKPNYKNDEDGKRISCGKTIKQSIEVYLSSTKEETKELWNKGDIKTLTNYFVSNTWVFYIFSPKQYEPDDKGTLQLIYDEKDNSVEIDFQDVDSYQREV